MRWSATVCRRHARSPALGLARGIWLILALLLGACSPTAPPQPPPRPAATAPGPPLAPAAPAATAAPTAPLVALPETSATALYEPPDGQAYFGFTLRLWDLAPAAANAAVGDTRPFAERLRDSIQTELGGKSPTLLAVPTIWQRQSGELLAFGETLDQIHSFEHFDGHDITPFVTWNAQTGWSDGRGYRGITTRDVASGALDAYIHRYARDVAAYGRPVFIRPICGEFNGSWWPSCSPQANPALTPEDFVAAWRRVVDVFRGEGASNVAWVWTPVTFPPAPEESRVDRAIDRYYPGDAYVDWAGADHYDDGPPSRLAPVYDFALAHRKPFFLAEWGVRLAGTGLSPAEQRQWLEAMFDSFASHPRIKAILYFNYNMNTDDASSLEHHVFALNGQVNYAPTNNSDHRLITGGPADFQGAFAGRIRDARYISTLVGPGPE